MPDENNLELARLVLSSLDSDLFKRFSDLYVVTASSIFSPVKSPIFHRPVTFGEQGIDWEKSVSYTECLEYLDAIRTGATYTLTCALELFRNLEEANALRDKVAEGARPLHLPFEGMPLKDLIKLPGDFSSPSLVKVVRAEYFMKYWEIMHTRNGLGTIVKADRELKYNPLLKGVCLRENGAALSQWVSPGLGNFMLYSDSIVPEVFK